MKIVTFNINSVRARLESFLDYLKNESPEVVLLQEIKCQDRDFPFMFFENIGYNVKIFGQKSYNGVAILSKYSIEDVVVGLPNFEDVNSRYIEALIDGRVRVASIYAPNGNPVGSEKYEYKLAWHKAFNEYAKQLFSYDEAVVLAGDFNVIYEERDAYSFKVFEDNALAQKEVRDLFGELFDTGYVSAFVKLNPDYKDEFSWWGYMRKAFENNKGVLIDHLLLNEQALDLLENSGINKELRAVPKASDHTAVWVELKNN